jgi:hypothetical protein
MTAPGYYQVTAMAPSWIPNHTIYTEFFHQLSQICLKAVISNGLLNLISVQKNLKYLYMSQYNSFGIEDLLKKIPNTLISFALMSLWVSLIIYFLLMMDLVNLEEIIGNWDLCREHFESYFVVVKQIMKFLKNNGRNLKQIHFNIDHDETICECCKNIRILHIKLTNESGLSELCNFFDALPLLESIKICYIYPIINEKFLFNCYIKKSPKNFCELK